MISQHWWHQAISSAYVYPDLWRHHIASLAHDEIKICLLYFISFYSVSISTILRLEFELSNSNSKYFISFKEYGTMQYNIFHMTW